MATEERDEQKKPVTPLTDPEFRRAGLAPLSIEELRKWEQIWVRYGIIQNNTNIGEVSIGSPLVIPPYGVGHGMTGEVRFM